jgi:hypothetical protein
VPRLGGWWMWQRPRRPPCGCPLVSVQTAMSKACAAAAIAMPPNEFYTAIEADGAAVASFAGRPGMALIAGSLPLLADGQLAGAIGVWGLATVSADLPAGPSAHRPAPLSSSPGTGVAPATDRRTNPLAMAALVCSVIPGLPQLAAIVLGIAALRQVRRTSERGAALAAAGLVIATLGLLLAMLLVL